jgi:hypothetical protein
MIRYTEALGAMNWILLLLLLLISAVFSFGVWAGPPLAGPPLAGPPLAGPPLAGPPTLHIYVGKGPSIDSKGTKLIPMPSLEMAIKKANDSNKRTVIHISEGEFSVGNGLAMGPDIELVGGHKIGDYDIRDPSKYITKIVPLNPGAKEHMIKGFEGPNSFSGISFESGKNNLSYSLFFERGGYVVKNCKFTSSGGGGIISLAGSVEVIDSHFVISGPAKAFKGHNGKFFFRNNEVEGMVYADGAAADGVPSQIHGNRITCGNDFCPVALEIKTPAIIYKNQIFGGNTSGESIAMRIQHNNGKISNSLVFKNLISGGAATDSTGILVGTDNIQIFSNQIMGGAGKTRSIAVKVERSSAVFYNNLIHGGESEYHSYAIQIQSKGVLSRPSFFNNTISGGKGKKETISVQLLNSAAIFENNIVFNDSKARSCFYVHFDKQKKKVDYMTHLNISNNNLSQCDAVVEWAGEPPFNCSSNNDGDKNDRTCGVGDLEASKRSKQFSRNHQTKVNFVSLKGPDGKVKSLSDNDWRLPASVNPKISAGGVNGANHGWPVKEDFSGHRRTGKGAHGWSLGAFEAD